MIHLVVNITELLPSMLSGYPGGFDDFDYGNVGIDTMIDYSVRVIDTVDHPNGKWPVSFGSVVVMDIEGIEEQLVNLLGSSGILRKNGIRRIREENNDSIDNTLDDFFTDNQDHHTRSENLKKRSESETNESDTVSVPVKSLDDSTIIRQYASQVRTR